PASQLISTAMIFGALALLSPFHHQLEDVWALLTGHRLRGTAVGSTLFVCSGESCRAQLAAALRQMAGPSPPKTPKPMHSGAVAAADVIYCMTEQERAALLDRYPEAAAKARCIQPDVGVLAELGV